ncbi:MAG: DUF4923 family protein [Bacteroidales bacterium]|nr:DUF4923 family protein [Bacteroidales bacterium]
MKKKLLGTAIFGAMLCLASCGGLGTMGTGTGLGTGTSTSGAINSGSLISGIIGQLIGNTTNANSIVGTWVYTEPTVQFESENFLAQAGGTVASAAIVNKIKPYYQKIGIKPGAFSFTFNSNNTCTYTLKGQTYQGTYSYNPSNNTITIQGQILTFPSAYVTVSANQMALTFESTKLLTLAQGVASASQNATLSTLGSLSSSFSGMKTGFMFQKR